MTPELASRLLDLYSRAGEAAAADALERASALVAEAGEALRGPPAALPEDPGARAGIAALAEACSEAHQACMAAVMAARERLHQRAANDLRAGSAAGRYAEQGTPDARFIDRRS